MDWTRLEDFANQFLERYGGEKHRYALAAFKGLRNGIVYGVKIRAPHALLTVFLFGNGSFVEKLYSILKMTAQHSYNLGRFVFGYKLIMGLLRWKLSGGHYKHWHPFVAASLLGYFVFGEKNSINTQINLYLLSRIIYASAKLIASLDSRLYNPNQNFPIFAAFVWGFGLWLFENHQNVLQKSLQHSMTYLYHNSNIWTNIRNFLFHSQF